jgi:hypothetical protein
MRKSTPLDGSSRSYRPAPTCSDTSSSISASANSRTPSRNTSKALSPWS